MHFSEYQSLARRTQNKRLNSDERLQHALYGLPSEVGEICGLFQKVFQGHQLDIGKVADEISDTLWFLGELCDVLGLDMDEVAEHNIEKLRQRYPDGFSEYRSTHRME